jgi:hypothetical protein
MSHFILFVTNLELIEKYFNHHFQTKFYKIITLKINLYIITVRTNGKYNSSICNNANFNRKLLRSQKMQTSNIFG